MEWAFRYRRRGNTASRRGLRREVIAARTHRRPGCQPGSSDGLAARPTRRQQDSKEFLLIADRRDLGAAAPTVSLDFRREAHMRQTPDIATRYPARVVQLHGFDGSPTSRVPADDEQAVR